MSDVDEDEDKEKKPKTKKIKQTKKEWELINDTKAIWVRAPSDVADEEYNNFFKSLTKEFDDPLDKVRVRNLHTTCSKSCWIPFGCACASPPFGF